MPDPRKKLLFRLAIEKVERLSQVFMDLEGHRHLQLVRKSVHEVPKTVYVFAKLILDCHLEL